MCGARRARLTSTRTVFETISGVSEVVVRGVSADGARVLSSSGGGTVVAHGLVVFIEVGARVELDCGSWFILSGRSARSF